MKMSEIIEALNCISVGDVLKWIMIIATLVTALAAVSVRCYKLSGKYWKAKSCAADKDKTIEDHTESIKSVKEDIKQLVEFNLKMVEVNKIITRNSIVRICNESLDVGYIDSIQLQALEDSYDMYQNVLHGNSYVSALVGATRKLRIVVRGIEMHSEF